MTTIDIVVNAKIAELKAISDARYARITSAYKDSNNGMEITVDRAGRWHSPCDGFIDPVRENIYGKGEFIPMPEDIQDDPIHSANFAVKETKVRMSVSQVEELRSCVSDLPLEVRAGKIWNDGVTDQCYAYLRGKSALLKVIVEFYKSQLAATIEAKKALKGDAPIGRVTVKGRVLAIKEVVDFGMTLVKKMLVELDNGATVYGTLPKFLKDSKNGDAIEFTATFEQAKNDKTHAFFKRPTH